MSKKVPGGCMMSTAGRGGGQAPGQEGEQVGGGGTGLSAHPGLGQPRRKKGAGPCQLHTGAQLPRP